MVQDGKRPLKVFLCHASGDKPAVRVLYQRLVRDGVDAWLDKEKLLPGQDWQLEIPKAVRESDVVVVCLSKKSTTKEGYVQKEIKFALDVASEKPEGTIFLIPARLEECDVPSQLGLWQWVDLFESDGYERLMRSLQLRADKFGLRVGDTVYTDQEFEQRLDDLYTEGLAALWVEDWDKAYRRFQTILREKPDYLQAASKLEEAKRQKHLNDLYTQALAAYEKGNWQEAIELLEKLTGEFADYKDASLLLKNAQKKNQITRLYEEARRLYKAKQWQAVIKVFSQIAAMEPDYQDPDGLLASAEKQTAELKRLSDLNDLYRQGIRAMDAGQWYEARKLLEQVHKAQIGFLETERLLRKVEDEIRKIEALNQRNIHVNTLYEQAHQMISSKNWRKALDKMIEIQKLDEQFIDTDGIFEKAKTELEHDEQETQRQKELNSLYAEAVSLLQAKKYQEVLEKWNEVQTINPKYKDAARVKAIAKKKLDELTQPEVAGRTWLAIISNWFRSEANIPADREILAERLLLLSFAVVVTIHELWDIVAGWLKVWESLPVFMFIYWCLLGGLYGTIIAFVLNKSISDWQRKHSLTLIIGWALGFAVPYTPVLNWRMPPFGDSLYWYLALSIIIAIKWAKPAARPVNLIIIFASWALMWRIGDFLGNYLGPIYNSPHTWALTNALQILLGLLFTLGIQIEDTQRVLKTAFWGALGFAVGDFVANTVSTLSLPVEILFVVWGLIGGAVLKAPSRNSRRILFSAMVCGIGLLVGSFIAFDVLPNFQYTNSAFADRNIIVRQAFLGMGLGVALGLLIRRASATGVLAVLGAGMYMMTRALNVDVLNISPFWENIVRGALIGLVLGYGYGYMGKAKPLESKPRVAKTRWVWIAIIGIFAIAVPVVVWLASPPAITSYHWDFDSSTEGWGDYHDIINPKVENGSLTLKSTGLDPSFESPASLVISASDTPVITVRMRLTQGQGTVGQIYFITDQDNNWDETKSVVFTLDQSAIFRTYRILMSENPAWQGTITKIRLDPVGDPSGANMQFAIDYISVHAP